MKDLLTRIGSTEGAPPASKRAADKKDAILGTPPAKRDKKANECTPEPLMRPLSQEQTDSKGPASNAPAPGGSAAAVLEAGRQGHVLGRVTSPTTRHRHASPPPPPPPALPTADGRPTAPFAAAAARRDRPPPYRAPPKRSSATSTTSR